MLILFLYCFWPFNSCVSLEKEHQTHKTSINVPRPRPAKHFPRLDFQRTAEKKGPLRKTPRNREATPKVFTQPSLVEIRLLSLGAFCESPAMSSWSDRPKLRVWGGKKMQKCEFSWNPKVSPRSQEDFSKIQASNLELTVGERTVQAAGTSTSCRCRVGKWCSIANPMSSGSPCRLCRNCINA